MKVVIAYSGYLPMGDMAVGLRVGELLDAELKRLNYSNVELLDVSTDVLTAVDLINERRPDVLILVGAKRRGRVKGAIEVIRPKLEPVKDNIEANDLLRPSLDGRICITDVLNGLRVLGTTAREIILIECEPPHDEPYIGLSNEGERCAANIVNIILNEILPKIIKDNQTSESEYK